MGKKKYETLLHQWMEEVWHNADLSAVDRLLKPGAKVHGLRDENGKPIVGRAAFKRHVSHFRRMLPDMRIDIVDFVSRGHKTAVRCVVTGTHLGAGFGLPPTGKKVEFHGMVIAHEKNGVFVEGWNSFDYMDLCRQLGQGI